MKNQPRYDALFIQNGAITERIAPDGRRGIEFGILNMETKIEGDKVILRVSQSVKINPELLIIDPSKITGVTGLMQPVPAQESSPEADAPVSPPDHS